jgi:hypothetical protein
VEIACQFSFSSRLKICNYSIAEVVCLNGRMIVLRGHEKGPTGHACLLMGVGLIFVTPMTPSHYASFGRPESTIDVGGKGGGNI